MIDDPRSDNQHLDTLRETTAGYSEEEHLIMILRKNKRTIVVHLMSSKKRWTSLIAKEYYNERVICLKKILTNLRFSLKCFLS